MILLKISGKFGKSVAEILVPTLKVCEQEANMDGLPVAELFVLTAFHRLPLFQLKTGLLLALHQPFILFSFQVP